MYASCEVEASGWLPVPRDGRHERRCRHVSLWSAKQHQNRQDYRMDRTVVCRLRQPRCVPENDNSWEQHRENPCSPWYVNPVNPVILSSRFTRDRAGAGIINN